MAQRTDPARRPVIGVLCCNEVADRPVQVVASRFVAPLTRLAGATVLLVPAMPDTADVATLAQILDGLLLTGSRSHVAPWRYGGPPLPTGQVVDEPRDEVALALAGRMIAAGKPVFGICRGLQEINVLFGGTLAPAPHADRHHRGAWEGDYESLFHHGHDVELVADGRLADATGTRRMRVNSVHQQGIDRLGSGLTIEAIAADDGLIEAVSARPCGADVLGVQWHPEWDVAEAPASRAFFSLIGAGLRGHTDTLSTRRTR
ncbi:gamma-glutamyl-gamma-aminobutyrate hydrolase family protein [Sphingomonas sp. RP10(2022)]|uniref:Gamma-glutamyl-gamma-aminobutyrate hydrolase family protein n=1 Tax=Sphingomonas liriopis TaxID=2949094 RepID=A0A9X2HXZ5_9SPHN|nr:gamma-glutamyl-gamma-aminobutyrate hydrolase family protein [Sphingomonas liriopis]MCP3734130.1 gamma-glutamyl-gamma-aminobutyrate hydrolase family protein [Sphingomonas liriopis]